MPSPQTSFPLLRSWEMCRSGGGGGWDGVPYSSEQSLLPAWGVTHGLWILTSFMLSSFSPIAIGLMSFKLNHSLHDYLNLFIHSMITFSQATWSCTLNQTICNSPRWAKECKCSVLWFLEGRSCKAAAKRGCVTTIIRMSGNTHQR